MVQVKQYNLKVQKALEAGTHNQRWMGRHLSRLRNLRMSPKEAFNLVQKISAKEKIDCIFDESFKNVSSIEDLAYFMDIPKVICKWVWEYPAYNEVQKIYDSNK